MPRKQRVGDKFLVEQLISIRWMLPLELVQFNQCCTHMQAMMLADIIKGDSISICRFSRAYHPTACNSKWEWAQEWPSGSDWNVWRRWLKQLTSENLSLPHFNKLGKWMSDPHTEWDWYFSPSTHLLYKKDGKVWHK